MPLSHLPLLSLAHVNQFTSSKRFYHFNHSYDIKSLTFLELALKQYNAIVDQNRLLEESIREIERSVDFLSLLNNADFQAKINHFRCTQASFLCHLKELLLIIDEQATHLHPIIKKRKNCPDVESFLEALLDNKIKVNRVLAEEQFSHMELNCQQTMVLTEKQFIMFHQHIEEYATAKLLGRYHRLNWFLEPAYGEKLVKVASLDNVYFLLASVKPFFEHKINGIKRFFFNENDKARLGEQHFYRMASLRSEEQALIKHLTLLNPQSFLTGSFLNLPSVLAITRLENSIQEQQRALRRQIATGIRRFFYPVKNNVLSAEIVHLNAQLVNLQEKRMDLIEKALITLDNTYPIDQFVMAPTETLVELETTLKTCDTQLSRLPLDSVTQQRLQNRLQQLTTHYAKHTHVALYFVETLIQNEKYFATRQTVAPTGITYLSCDAQVVSQLIHSLKPYVDPSIQEALDVVQALLLGETVPPLVVLNEKLLPLFNDFKHPLATLDVFLEKIMNHYVKPGLQDPRSSHFKLLEDYDRSFINHWCEKKVTSLDDALLFLNSIFSGTALNNQALFLRHRLFTSDQATFFSQIQLIKSFSHLDQGKGYFEAVLQSIEQAISRSQEKIFKDPVFLEGIFMLGHERLNLTFIQALLDSCIKQNDFTLLAHDTVIDYINQHEDALARVSFALSATFQDNDWQPSLQACLDRFADPALARHYRVLYVQKVITDPDFATRHPDESRSWEALENAIGAEKLPMLYIFLKDTLSADKTLHTEALSLIHSLLNAEWGLDSQPLKVLLNAKRKALIEQSDVALEAKAMLAMLKKSEWCQAFEVLKDHITLSQSDLEGAHFHAQVVLTLLHQLPALHSHQQRDVRSGLRQDISLHRQQRWTFYQGLHSLMNSQKGLSASSDKKRSAFLPAFKNLEQHWLASMYPLAYFLDQFSHVQQATVFDEQAVMTQLSACRDEIANSLSRADLQAIDHLLTLIAGKWVPQHEKELNEKVLFLWANFNGAFSYPQTLQYLLKHCVIPRIKTRTSPGFLLAYEINPEWMAPILQTEKEKVENHLFLLKAVFEQNIPLNDNAFLFVNGRKVKVSGEDCLLAINDILNFVAWQTAHGNPCHYVELVNSMFSDFLEVFKASDQQSLDILPLLEAYGNEALLEAYLTCWVQQVLHASSDYSLIQSATLVRYVAKPVVQDTIQNFIMLSAERLAQRERPADENPLLSGFYDRFTYPDQAEQLFPLIALLEPANREATLAMLVNLQSAWKVEWHHYLASTASETLQQRYRVLFVAQLFAHPDFCQSYADYFPCIPLEDYESVYGREGVLDIVQHMEAYVAAPLDPCQKKGYQFIVTSLEKSTCHGPFEAIKQKATQHLRAVADREEVEKVILDFREKITTKDYTAASTLVQQWCTKMTWYAESLPEYLRYSHYIDRSVEVLRHHLTALIPRKEACEIALIRDEVLAFFPKNSAQKQLVHLSNQHTSLCFPKDTAIVGLYQRLHHFEDYAWYTLKKSLPALSASHLADLNAWVKKLRQKNQETIGPCQKDSLQRHGLSKELIELYQRHEKTIKPILHAMLTAHHAFTKLGGRSLDRATQFAKVDRLISDETRAWHKASKSFWAPFFGNKPNESAGKTDNSLDQEESLYQRVFHIN